MKLKDKFFTNPDKLRDLEIDLKVEIASKEMPLKELLQLKEENIFIFDENLSAPLHIIAQDQKIAEATLVKVKDGYGVKITKILRKINELE